MATRAFPAGLIIAACLLTSCSDHESARRRAFRDAISEVILEEDTIIKDMVREMKEAEQQNWFGASGVTSKAHVKLSMIDTSRCPEDFQKAFSEELAIIKEMVDVFESTQGFGNRIANALTYGGYSGVNALLAWGDLQRRLDDAMLKKSLVAEKYGLGQE